MITAIRHKGELAAVRRPLQVAILAPIKEEPFGLPLASESDSPDMIILRVGELPARGNRGCVTFGNLYRGASGQRHRPDCRQRLLGRGGWIRCEIPLSRPVCIVIAAAYVYEASAIWRESKLRDFLPVVLGVMGELSRDEFGLVREPNIPDAVQVAYPRNLVTSLGGSQLGRIRVVEHLCHRESGMRRRLLEGGESQNKSEESAGKRADRAHEQLRI